MRTCPSSTLIFFTLTLITVRRYLRCHANDDGGWGLHIEGHSTVFGTAMNYIAYRLLGASPSDATCVKARTWLRNVPGAALGIPSWGKFWLATLGLYSWDGLNVIPPELWLLPYWLPLNPGRLWCHCRVVYLPMCYIYGNRFTAKETPLIRQLREELFTENFSSVDWSKQRNHVAEVDLYTPHSRLLKIFNWIAYQYEKVHSGWLRRKALAIALDHIHHEDLTTKYIDIGPVNKAINMLAIHYSGNLDAHKKHTERIRDYLWIAEDGMKMQGYNGSQLWDTAFAAQAIFESGLARDFKTCLAKVHNFLDVTQVLEDVDDNVKYYRHISKGAWPFSTVDHGWPISDCTSEGLKAALLYVENSKVELVPKFLEEERFQFSVNYLLSMQNKDGGWATYELTRGGQLLESLNCSEVFGDIMIDYTYVECTSACVQALHRFALLYPNHRSVLLCDRFFTLKLSYHCTEFPFFGVLPVFLRSEEVRSSIRRGQDMIKSIQKSDGSWYGSWAICFTYACWFGIEALALDDSSRKANKALIEKCCGFLLSKQMKDGGWGESYQSCVRKEYRDSESGHVVCTAWALLSLILANPRATASSDVVQAVERGVRFLMNAQLPNGDWAQQSISGVFNRNCMISYSNYRSVVFYSRLSYLPALHHLIR